MGVLRRRLLAMPTSVPIELEHGTDRTLGLLRGDVLNRGSSWAALCICLSERPPDLRALLALAGVTHGQLAPFNACADAYSVYEDACRRGKLKV